MEALTKAALLAAAEQALPIEPCEIPSLGLKGFIKALSGAERDAWERSLVRVEGKRITPNTDNVRARFLARVFCDESGQRIFTDADAAAIGKLPASVVAPLYEQAQRLSAMSNADLDELGKGSEPAAGTGSSSSSPSD